MAWREVYLQATCSSATTKWARAKPSKVWATPEEGSLKLNVDGAFLASIQYGGTRGVLRNSQGQFLAGFSFRVDFVTYPLHVELLTLKNGLELLQAMQITHAPVESDCLIVVQAIASITPNLSPLSALITDIQGLLAGSEDLKLLYVPRQANTLAHRLANFNFDSNVHLDWFVNAPEFTLDALMYDFSRIK
ncbi:putative ribonuclease H-like domain-containing protein [Rosa chinensis]|uniref:Putative ribonuclease H-like domain-containing protein n=1 Tax=Rosa chinensis TaxID=74649 RepID=A0A2P6RSW7_ROSCH|nr:putative ribonuclease H-like domain-containing protein [Rosa chinensis]